MVIVAVEAVKGEFRAVALMRFRKAFQIEMIEKRFWAVMGDIRQEERMIVNIEIGAQEGFLVPQNGDVRLFIAVRAVGLDCYVVEFLIQRDFCGERTPFAFRFHAIDGDAVVDVGDASHFNGQTIGILYAMVVVENSSMSREMNIQHIFLLMITLK